MYARSLLEFEKQSWLVLEMVQVFLQWGQVERSTTQPWDLSFSSSGGPESPPTISLVPFPSSMRLVYFDTWGCWRKPGYRCWPISHICWWSSLGLVDLPPSPHDAFWGFVWRQYSLVETSRLSIIWQFVSLKLAGAKTTSETERQQVNIPLSLDTVAGVTASLGLYPTMWIL